ncbi:MAG: hypothetical protein K0R38_203 [Polyangiaceae bacterium]|jgi:tetratricopeptide (TPR) repeat protein|nr:hypothetical protein [Polyangiaceae bacterium]
MLEAEMPFTADSVARLIAAAPKPGPEVLAFTYLGTWGLAHLASSLTIDGKPRLVGRELESVRLLHAIDAVTRENAAVVASIAGVAGAGKTRLLEDTLMVAEASGFEGRVVSVAAQPGDGPNATIARLLSTRFGLNQKSAAFKRDCLLRRVRELLGDDRVEDVCYFLGTLVGAHFEQTPLTRVLSQQSFHAELALQSLICELFAADSRRAPLCLVIEDLHHMDRESLGTLLALTDDLQPGTLLLCSGHPDFFRRNEHFGQTGSAQYEPIELTPLQADEVRAMLRQVVGPCTRGADAFERYMLESGLGNPGLIQELVRELWAYGALQASIDVDGCEFDGARLPDIASSPRLKVAMEVRVSGLPELEQALLEAASVVGSVFWAGMWPALLPICSPGHAEASPEQIELALGRLERDGHLLRMPDSRIEGEVELVFRDGSERECFERAVNPSRRRALHRVIADWLSPHERSLGASSELVVLLARHLARSGSGYRAAFTLLCAARVACNEGAGLKAAGYFEQALEELGEQDNRMRVDALCDFGTLLGQLGRRGEARGAFTQMAELAKRLNLHAKRGIALHRLGRLHREAGELLLARRSLERALRASEAGRDAQEMASTQDDLGMVLWLLGDRTQALPLLRAALKTHKAARDEQGMAVSLSGLALVWNDEGRAATSQRAAGIVREICERGADAAAKCDAELVRAHLATHRHDLQEARSLYRRAAELAFSAQDRHRSAQSLVRLGICELRCDDLDRAEELLTRGAQLAQDAGSLLELAEARRGLAKLSLKRRRLDDARKHAASALRLARRLRCPQRLAATLRTMADVAAATSKANAEQRIVGYYVRSIEVCKQLEDEHELAKGYRAFARFAGRFEHREIRRQSEMLRDLSDAIFSRLEKADAA